MALDRLCARFPDVERDLCHDVLGSVDDDLEKAADYLRQMGKTQTVSPAEKGSASLESIASILHAEGGEEAVESPELRLKESKEAVGYEVMRVTGLFCGGNIDSCEPYTNLTVQSVDDIFHSRGDSKRGFYARATETGDETVDVILRSTEPDLVCVEDMILECSRIANGPEDDARLRIDATTDLEADTWETIFPEQPLLGLCPLGQKFGTGGRSFKRQFHVTCSPHGALFWRFRFTLEQRNNNCAFHGVRLYGAEVALVKAAR